MAGTTFVQNIAAGVAAFGLEAAPVIWSLAQVAYDSSEERDQLFNMLGGNSD